MNNLSFSPLAVISDRTMSTLLRGDLSLWEQFWLGGGVDAFHGGDSVGSGRLAATD